MHLPDDTYAIVLRSMPIPCVDLLVTDPANRVLLIHRLNPPAQGQWWLPGGRVLRDETRAAAAARKLREECGLDAISVTDVGTYDMILPEQHAVSTVFHLTVASTEVRLDAQSGHYDWRTRAEWLRESLHPYVVDVLRTR